MIVDMNLDMNALSAIAQQLASNPEIAKITGGKPPSVTPEMMSALPSIMQAIAPGFSGTDKNEKASGDGGEVCDAECRKRLLLALKPYLSDGRRDALEGILAVAQLGDLLAGFDKKGG